MTRENINPVTFFQDVLMRWFLPFAVPLLEKHPHFPDVLQRGVWDEEE